MTYLSLVDKSVVITNYFSTAGPGPGVRKGGSLMTIWKLLKKPTDMSSPPCKLIVLMSEKDEICYYQQHNDLYCNKAIAH